MAETPVVVVSAGVKSIVDVGHAEWLETLGVPILGLGTEAFPCFIAGVDKEGVPGVIKVESEGEVGSYREPSLENGRSKGGLLLAVPLDEDAVLDADLVRKANDEAEDSATQAGGTVPTDSPSSSHMAQKTGWIASSPISNCCWPMPKSPLVWPEVWASEVP